MKVLLRLALVLSLCLEAFGQTAVITGTATDSDGTAWVGGTYTITLIPSQAGTPTRIDNGQNVSPTVFNGTLDGTGSLSVTITSANNIRPAGSSWQVKICPNVSSGTCGTISISANSSGSISSQINAAITAPRISGGIGAYAYADVEVSAIPNNSYYNVTSTTIRCYGSSWGACGGGGGAPSGPAGGVLSGTYPNPGLASNGAIPNGWTATTQSTGDNTGKVSTDAFVQASFAAPSVLGSATPNSINATGTLSPSVSTYSNPGASVPNIIYDDDCDQDEDCNMTMRGLTTLVDNGQIKLLGVVADSTNASSVLAMHVYLKNFGLTSVPLGANTNSGTGSGWTQTLATQFDPGDVASNYPSCVTVYRTTLAAAANASVTMVVTGYLTCVSALMQSPADGISSMTGAQLIQAKVSLLVDTGGYEPSTGSAEFNFSQDKTAAAYVTTNWTSGNGYPPIYFIGVNTDYFLWSLPKWIGTGDPTAWVAVNDGGNYASSSYDVASLLYASVPSSQAAYTLSANGTNTVNASTGVNTFSTGTASGQYYLVLNQAATYYQNILGGYNGSSPFQYLGGLLAHYPSHPGYLTGGVNGLQSAAGYGIQQVGLTSGTPLAGNSYALTNPNSSYDYGAQSSELTSSTAGNWTSTGWTQGTLSTGLTSTNNLTFANNASNTTALTTATPTVVNGTWYQVSWVSTGCTTGTVQVAIGGVNLGGAVCNANNTLFAKAISTASLTFTPTSTYNGTLENISVKSITGISTPVLELNDSTNSDSLEVRAPLATLFNTFVGYQAGQNNINGNSETYFGYQAGQAETSGIDNSLFGYQAGYSITTNQDITAVGYQACKACTGNYVTAFGFQAGLVNTSGGSTFFGTSAGAANTTGTGNVFVGDSAGKSSVSTNNNTYIGSQAGQSATGQYETGIGYQALQSVTGPFNYASGASAGASLTSGGSNVFDGVSAGQYIATTSNNVCVGSSACRYLANGSTTNTSSANSTFLGTNTYASAASDTNETVVGYAVIGNGSNTTTIGSSSTTQTYLAGVLLPVTIYSNAGTQLAACASALSGAQAVVSDASSLTPGTAYSVSAGAGSIKIRVQCAYSGSTYAWQTM